MAVPKTLVLVPSYNHGGFIADRVTSILDQTNGDFDLRIIDDCSSDQTMDVLAGFADPRMQVVRRERNSGSPFTAWLDLARPLDDQPYDFVWIAESDDRAEPHFLERGVAALTKDPGASLYYCHSWFIDDDDLIIGHSINYLNRVFPGIDWTSPWSQSGADFIRTCLIRGMSVPNMSSSLIRASAFRSSVQSRFQRFKLAADWLFVIGVATTGGIVFDPWDGNFFRHHARTSRVETNRARMLFEHMSATRAAYLTGAVDRKVYARQMGVWTGMVLRERALANFIRCGWHVSPRDLFRSVADLARL